MAQLNLRDRVIETTIAYVGAGAAVASSSFAHVEQALLQGGRVGTLRETPRGQGRVLSIDWTPSEDVRLSDCEVTVRLVATDGVEQEAVQELLADTDGLILVVDARAAALDQNRRAVNVVRHALARAQDRRLPVVVHVIEAEAGRGGEGLDALGPEEWPRVYASNADGGGLLEAARRTLAIVVETLQNAQSTSADAAPSRSVGQGKVDGNPLLSALRKLIQSTVSEQLVALENRLDERRDGLASQIDVLSRNVEALTGALRLLAEEGPADRTDASLGRAARMHALSGLVEGLQRRT